MNPLSPTSPVAFTIASVLAVINIAFLLTFGWKAIFVEHQYSPILLFLLLMLSFVGASLFSAVRLRSKTHKKPLTFFALVFIVLFLANLLSILLPLAMRVSGGYYMLGRKSDVSNEQAYKIYNDMSNWKTYSNEKRGIELKYPSNLEPHIISSAQVFLSKENATEWDMHEPIEINFSIHRDRFEAYYQAKEGTVLEGYNDLKIRNFTIEGFPAVEYGCDEKKKEREVFENSKGFSSSGMVYFDRGVIIDRDGQLIQVSTKNYRGGFKKSFDQIVESIKFYE